jgi:hypothetical protein
MKVHAYPKADIFCEKPYIAGKTSKKTASIFHLPSLRKSKFRQIKVSTCASFHDESTELKFKDITASHQTAQAPVDSFMSGNF